MVYTKFGHPCVSVQVKAQSSKLDGESAEGCLVKVVAFIKGNAAANTETHKMKWNSEAIPTRLLDSPVFICYEWQSRVPSLLELSPTLPLTNINN